MKKIFFLLSLAVLFSCDIMKKSQKNKRDTDSIEENESWRKRKGDTVSFNIPILKYKDTTIYTVNREGTTLRTSFDSNGNIDIDCMASAIEEMNRNYMRLLETEKTKGKEKTENFDSSVILYAVGGFAAIIVFGFIMIFLLISRQAKTIMSLIPRQ